MDISFTAKVSIADDILVRELENESVILNLNSESYYGLDEIGTRFWNVLTTSESIQDAYEALLGEFEVDAHMLRKDLTQMVKKLIDKGMLKLNDGKVEKV